MTNEPLPTVTNQLPMPVPEPRRRWVTVVAVVMIFCAGLASGAGLTVVFAVHRLQDAIHHPEKAPARVAKMLQSRLGLDEKQEMQIESIVAKRQVELTAIRQRFHPEIEHQLDQLHQEIGEVLTELQRKHWAKMFGEFRERWLPPAPTKDAS